MAAAIETEYKFRNDKGVLAKLESMLNNEERSDTLFLVNTARYRVLSHLVAAYSPVLESMINEQFIHCDDREIQIRNVRNEDSFHLLLKFIYGVEMNFTQINIIVICEALSLAEKYEIGDFSEELKSYISSTPARFQIDTVVVLLNTARKLNLIDLYKKAKVYAYENTEQLMKHDSFVDLQYEVLVDLLKSDWFYAKEIEILNGMLTWHDDMDSKKNKIKVNETTEQHNDSGFERNENNDNHSVVSKKDLVDYYETKSEDNKGSSSTNDNNSGLENISELSGETSNSNNIDIPIISSAELVKSFKENVMKSLLSFIRIGQISTLDHLKAFETELFTKYKPFVTDYKLYSQSTDPRKKYVSTVSSSDLSSLPRGNASFSANDTLNPGNHPTNAAALHNEFFNLKRTFTFKRHAINTVYESEEEYSIGCLKFKMDFKEYYFRNDSKTYFLFGIICTADEEKNWKCSTTITGTWYPRQGSNRSKLLVNTSGKQFLFTKEESRKNLNDPYLASTLNLADFQLYNDYVIDNTVQIEIEFHNIHFWRIDP